MNASISTWASFSAKKFRDEVVRWPVAGLTALPRCIDEEKRRLHFQNGGDLLKPARADAVAAFLVFLHLLER
jgi:hypothetical protein